jgi:hypothetical protein
MREATTPRTLGAVMSPKDIILLCLFDEEKMSFLRRADTIIAALAKNGYEIQPKLSAATHASEDVGSCGIRYLSS